MPFSRTTLAATVPRQLARRERQADAEAVVFASCVAHCANARILVLAGRVAPSAPTRHGSTELSGTESKRACHGQRMGTRASNLQFSVATVASTSERFRCAWSKHPARSHGRRGS